MQLDFREKAGRCRRLATVATEQFIRDELKRLADEFEKAALLLDISAMFSGTALAGGQDWRP